MLLCRPCPCPTVIFLPAGIFRRRAPDAHTAGGETLSLRQQTGQSTCRVDNSGVNISGVNMSGVHNSGVNISGVNISGVNISGVNISRVNISGVDISGVG